MTARDLLDRTVITDVWVALGGGPLRHGRGKAFWRGGDAHNISLDEAKAVWFDHAHGTGGGVLALIQTVLGCDRRDALRWLANHHNVQLDGRRPLTSQEKRAYAIRRGEAEREAAELTAWRGEFLRLLREERNHRYVSENGNSALARTLIEHPGPDDESAWDVIWRHALDDQKADRVQAEIERIEVLTPAEFAAELEAAA